MLRWIVAWISAVAASAADYADLPPFVPVQPADCRGRAPNVTACGGVILPGLVSAAAMQTFAERFLQRDMRELPRFGALRAHRYQVLVPAEADLVAAIRQLVTPAVLANVRELLSPDPAEFDIATVIRVDPGASRMELHRDTPEPGSVTVQFPLQKMADNAPLGFCVGTHSIPKPLSKKMYVAAGLRMDAPLQQAVFETFCPHGPLNVSGVGFGDVAMYDSRLYHWSYAHDGEEARHALYVVFKGGGHAGVHAEVKGGAVAEHRAAFATLLDPQEL